jgi:LDH2 family malate/lactate/ureidoglycolate dehydrogenase
MNKQPIETARDADLRLSAAAMHRAAQRARELAQQTGTAIVISRQGVVQQIRLPAAASDQAPGVQEPPAPYGGKP